MKQKIKGQSDVAGHCKGGEASEQSEALCSAGARASQGQEGSAGAGGPQVSSLAEHCTVSQCFPEKQSPSEGRVCVSLYHI